MATKRISRIKKRPYWQTRPSSFTFDIHRTSNVKHFILVTTEMNPKLWISLCSFLLLYNVAILWRDSYSINYVMLEQEDRLYDNASNFLICVQWGEIRYNNKLKNDSLLANASVPGAFELNSPFWSPSTA